MHFIKKIRNRFIAYLKQGMSAHELSLAVVAGLAIGTIPVIGITSVLCAIIALILRINMAAIQFINWLVYPLQLVLFIPFIQLGNLIFRNKKPIQDIDQLVVIFREDFWNALYHFWVMISYGLILWLMIMLPVSVLVYFTVKPMIVKFQDWNIHRKKH